ncbi:MAG TPA: bifunctional phosphoribosylaminoimidazolecarboxamide formyltransferase/IMP cyclohydrolase [Thermoanaerobaculia bacterium]|nr:bifunctional phosphoribosylaminoimidazolecarboxamide formyltransferase/IMP cyclohydrolase [Thermoanaerobaculia bacterium]
MNKKRALLSVSDRTGLVELAKALASAGYDLLSTGGTASHLANAGLSVISVSDETGFPEVFGGRVKTLHPKLFGGILYDRSVETHRMEAEENAIDAIDLVAVNLYPFEETLEAIMGEASSMGAPSASHEEIPHRLIEKIDVGGPSLLRAAAKNHAHVAVLCDPSDYPGVIDEIARTGDVSPATKRRLAAKVFRRTAAYDAAISRWFTRALGETFPERATFTYELERTLRYGENPHQRGAFYIDGAASEPALSRFAFVQGKELSYNNLLDADSALFAARSIGEDALVIVKHRIPSGAAVSKSLTKAFENAWASDPVSGFGGVVAYTGRLDRAGAEAMAARFLEVIVAYGVDDDAKEVFAKKANLRVLTVYAEGEGHGALEVRGVDGGLLVQERDTDNEDPLSWKVVTKREPSDAERRALAFANKAVRGVVSNAIVVAGEDATFGIGGGRTSRVDACKDAVLKAGDRAKGAVGASDAFFPFPDGLEVLADAGVTAVVQPGGSAKDADVVAAADARGLAMLFSARRHFRH